MLGLAIKGDTGVEREAGEHVGEDFVVRGEIAEHGVRDGVAAPIASVVAAAHGEEDEFLGIFDGEKAEEDLVEEGEDGGICADAEGQGEDGDDSEAGSAGKGAESVFEVAKRGVERSDSIHFAGFSLSFEISADIL